MTKERLDEIHRRWLLQRHRGGTGEGDRWVFEQCGGCLHWLALGGVLGSDWGVCSNGDAPFDGRVRFEHDGCDEFTEDPEGFGIQRG